MAEQLGLPHMIEGVISYQSTIENPGSRITPYESSLAIGDSIEFARLDAALDCRRADVQVRKACRVLPGLHMDIGARRISRRPLTPHTLPIIDCALDEPSVLIATGHGHLRTPEQ